MANGLLSSRLKERYLLSSPRSLDKHECERKVVSSICTWQTSNQLKPVVEQVDLDSELNCQRCNCTRRFRLLRYDRYDLIQR